MIDGLYSALSPENRSFESQSNKPFKVLRMVENERMGGSVPVWEIQKNDAPEQNLTKALNTQGASSPNNAHAYAASAVQTRSTHEEFGFGDLVDMVNPLHHIPLVGHIYRGITGDDIKPIGHIIGGALFGGPAGAASGLVNLVIEEETGTDVTGNAMAFVLNGEAPSFKPDAPQLPDQPETRLAAVTQTFNDGVPTQNAVQHDLPGNLLAFADLKARSEIVIKRLDAADGRTAGSFERREYPQIDKNPLPVREPITQVRFSNLND